MTELCEKILKYVSENEPVNTITLAELFKEDHQKVVGAVKSIQANGELIQVEPVSTNHLELTEEGKLFTEKGKINFKTWFTDMKVNS